MAGVVIRMKLAVLRHATTGPQAARTVTGAVVGLALALGVLALASHGWPTESVTLDLVGLALAVWTVGWILGPVLFGGGDESLRPEHFALLPLRPRSLTTALAAAALVGVAPAVTLVAFGSLVVVGVRGAAGTPAVVAVGAVGVVAALAQLVLTVVASRAVTAWVNQVMRSRTGAVLAGLVSAAILAGLHSVWVLGPLADQLTLTGLPPTAAAAVRAVPSGWGLSAVEAAVRGDWLVVAGALGGLLALTLVAWWSWAAVVGRRLGAQRAPGAHGSDRAARRALGPVTAVAARELRTWTRDLLRVHLAAFAVCYAVVFCLLPLTIDAPVFVPWVGLVLALWLAAVSSNLYGDDGTELWTKMTVPGALRADVRGRQLAWLLVAAPPSVLLTAVVPALAGQSAGQPGLWEWQAALLPAVLGGGAGVVVLVSVLRPVRLADPHRRSGNLLQNGVDFTQVLMVLVLTAVTAAPAGLVVAQGGPAWTGPVAGVASGAVLAWALGAIAAARLAATAPEMLLTLRTGVRPARAVPRPQLPGLPPRRSASAPTTVTGAVPASVWLERLGLDLAPAPLRRYVVVSLTLCWVPLAAQGVVPAIMLSTGNVTRSWFLALHVAPDLQWPVALAMIALGVVLLATGLGVGLHYLARATAQRKAFTTR